MIRTFILLVAMTGWFVGSSGEVDAADYHHVHLVASSAAEAKAWYMTHMGCTDYGRDNACASGDTLIIFLNANQLGQALELGLTISDFLFET